MSDQINKIIVHPVVFKYCILTVFVSGYVHVGGCCKHDHESPGSIKDGKFIN